MATIHLSKSENYRADTFPGILDSLGLSTQLKTAKVVVIKPNLVGYAIDEDRKAKSTPLWIIQETVAGIRACNKTAKILIVESDSGNWKHARDRFINHGLPILEEHDENLQLYNLSENPSDTRPFQGLYFKRRITLPSLFQEEIFFVSLAKVKTHRITVFSGILKNQFGCLPAISKAQYHTDLDRVLADINALIRPSLCILDACPGHGRGRPPAWPRPGFKPDRRLRQSRGAGCLYAEAYRLGPLQAQIHCNLPPSPSRPLHHGTADPCSS